MQDRTPTPGQEGRVLITPENGSAPFYAKVEMADNPTNPGTPLNKKNLLQDSVCAILEIPDTSTPNDAFAKLALGIGKYGYVVHVQYPDGSPASGYTLTGLNAPDGNPAITNENGDAVGVSSEQTVTVGVTSPFVDVEDIPETEIESTGILTRTTMVLSMVDTSNGLLLRTSQIIQLSPRVTTYDLCGVGGGGGGGNATNPGVAGSGGGGGYVQNSLNLDATDGRTLSVQIGAGGQENGGNGGTTTVSRNGDVILSAPGGNGGIVDAITHISGGQTVSGGAGNGNGGYGWNAPIHNTTSTGGTGGDSTGYLFNDEALGLAGGGGGAGAGFYGWDEGIPLANGGAPFGGDGGRLDTNGERYTPPTTPGLGGGGGGTTRNTRNAPTPAAAGGAGGLYLRCHYT